MSGTVWSKFYWSDWASDPKLRLCSAASQGMWMRMLCICAEADGYLTIAGRALTSKDLAAITGWPEHDVIGWMAELEQWGVYSVDGRGRIYSRRMVLDAKKARTARKNGKNGGNPSLGKHKGFGASDNPQVKPPLKVVDNTHKPIANSQKPEGSSPTSEKAEAQQSGQAARRGSRLSADWAPSEDELVYAIAQIGFSRDQALRVGEDFRDYWTAKTGADASKLDWPATWRRWVREEAKRRAPKYATAQPKRVGYV